MLASWRWVPWLAGSRGISKCISTFVSSVCHATLGSSCTLFARCMSWSPSSTDLCCLILNHSSAELSWISLLQWISAWCRKVQITRSSRLRRNMPLRPEEEAEVEHRWVGRAGSCAGTTLKSVKVPEYLDLWLSRASRRRATAYATSARLEAGCVLTIPMSHGC